MENLTVKEIDAKINSYECELTYSNLSAYADNIYRREIKRLKELKNDTRKRNNQIQ